MKPLLKEKINCYSAQQSQGVHQLGHWIGVPALLCAVLIFLNWFSISIGGRWHITFSWLGLALMLAYYYRLDVKLAVAATVLLSVLNLLCLLIAYPAPSAFSGLAFLVLCSGGLALQFWGRPEVIKDQSSLLQNLHQLLIAPLCLLVDLIKILKLESSFNLNE